MTVLPWACSLFKEGIDGEGESPGGERLSLHGRGKVTGNTGNKMEVTLPVLPAGEPVREALFGGSVDMPELQKDLRLRRFRKEQPGRVKNSEKE